MGMGRLMSKWVGWIGRLVMGVGGWMGGWVMDGCDTVKLLDLGVGMEDERLDHGPG